MQHDLLYVFLYWARSLRLAVPRNKRFIVNAAMMNVQSRVYQNLLQPVSGDSFLSQIN